MFVYVDLVFVVHVVIMCARMYCLLYMFVYMKYDDCKFTHVCFDIFFVVLFIWVNVAVYCAVSLRSLCAAVAARTHYLF